MTLNIFILRTAYIVISKNGNPITFVIRYFLYYFLSLESTAGEKSSLFSKRKTALGKNMLYCLCVAIAITITLLTDTAQKTTYYCGGKSL